MSALVMADSGVARRLGALRAFFVGRFGYLLLAAVLVVLLFAGDGTKSTTPDASRIAYLESIIRCPSCSDLSIADSETTSSVGLRRDVTNYVHEGLSDQTIEARVEEKYPNILLVPTGDAGVAVFLIPSLVIVVGAVAFGVLFVRRTRRIGVGNDRADQALVEAARRAREIEP